MQKKFKCKKCRKSINKYTYEDNNGECYHCEGTFANGCLSPDIILAGIGGIIGYLQFGAWGALAGTLIGYFIISFFLELLMNLFSD